MKKLAVLFAAVVVMAVAQQSEGSKPKDSEFYRLDFVLKEMEGSKIVKTHTYQMMVATDDHGISSIRSGAKLPVSGLKDSIYIDVGVNLDVRGLTATKDRLEFTIVAEASGILDAGNGVQSGKSPMIYETKWDSKIGIPIGKPTTVFSSDDPSSKRQLQLEVTATPIH